MQKKQIYWLVAICGLYLLIAAGLAWPEEEEEKKPQWALSVVTWYEDVSPEAVHLVYDYKSECEEAFERISQKMDEVDDPKFGKIVMECIKVLEQ
jgi:hypothetical protein